MSQALQPVIAEPDKISNISWYGDAFTSHREFQVSVVIPTFNEEQNLEHVLPRIPPWVHEIILVDGHSTDRTVERAYELCPRIRVVMQHGRGKGAALRSGFAVVTGDIIVMLDADGSMDPGEIPLFVGPLLAGADFAKGSRFAQGGGTADMPFHRRIGNGGFVGLVRLLFGGQFSDLCYGYNAFWADVLPALNLDGDGFEIETIMNVRALRGGLKVSEVPSFEAVRVHGTGRLQALPDGWRVLKAICREWCLKHSLLASLSPPLAPAFAYSRPSTPWTEQSTHKRERHPS